MSSFYGNGGYSSGSGSGGGGSLIVGCTINGTLEENGDVTLTSTWQEIYDAAAAGKTVVLDLRPNYEDITYLQGISSNNYQVMFSYFELFANSPNDFPTTPNNLNNDSTPPVIDPVIS